jgi:hypothetical protein
MRRNTIEFTHTHMQERTHTHIYIYVYVCIFGRTHTHTHIHTHTHMQERTHTDARRSLERWHSIEALWASGPGRNLRRRVRVYKRMPVTGTLIDGSPVCLFTFRLPGAFVRKDAPAPRSHAAPPVCLCRILGSRLRPYSHPVLTAEKVCGHARQVTDSAGRHRRAPSAHTTCLARDDRAARSRRIPVRIA